MSKDFIGFVKAHCPGKGKDGKARYITLGGAYKDSTSGSISFKIDALPVEASGWSGWCNVYSDDRPPQSGGVPRSRFVPDDDDIPF